MKRLILILAILFFAVPALAQPYITADPQTDATKYRIRFSTDGGVSWSPWTEGPPIDNALKFNIAGMQVADYKGEAQAGAVFEVTDTQTGQVTAVDEWSASSPFLLRVKRGNAPASLKVTK
jgi:hypothetical protein